MADLCYVVVNFAEMRRAGAILMAEDPPDYIPRMWDPGQPSNLASNLTIKPYNLSRHILW
jgi:hypothetical protein